MLQCLGLSKANGKKPVISTFKKNSGRVITKYNYNSIFSKAWLNSLVPANIVSGFKTCGVYPFNPKAVLDHDPCEASHSSGRDLQTSGPSSSMGDSSYTPAVADPEICKGGFHI